MQKAYTESVQAKVTVGCTLHELCVEDKSKVAKLLRQVCCISTSFKLKQLLSDYCLLQVVELERELTQSKAQGKKVCQQPAIGCSVHVLYRLYCYTLHEADRLDICLHCLHHALFVQDKIELQEKSQHLRQRSADMLHENNT